MVTSKFANRGTALYNMELLSASVIAHTLKSGLEPELKANPDFDNALEELSQSSRRKYRQLIEQPGIAIYLQQASPIEELSLLNMGRGRPAVSAPGALTICEPFPGCSPGARTAI